MANTDDIERVHSCLLAAFGNRWQAPYAEGKAMMADQVWEDLQIPHENAVQLIEELEADGRISFVGELGIAISPPTDLDDHPQDSSSLTPYMNTEGVQPKAIPEQPSLGEWTINEYQR